MRRRLLISLGYREVSSALTPKQAMAQSADCARCTGPGRSGEPPNDGRAFRRRPLVRLNRLLAFARATFSSFRALRTAILQLRLKFELAGRITRRTRSSGLRQRFDIFERKDAV